MAPTDHKDLFAQAYVRAVSAVAGYIPGAPELDRDSVDLVLSGQSTADLPSPRLEIQLKGTHHQPEDGVLKYALKQKNYDDLRFANLLVPKILVVVITPSANTDDWLKQSPHQRKLRRCGYWTSLRGMPPTGNTATTTVDLQMTDRFDVETLRSLMDRISRFDFP